MCDRGYRGMREGKATTHHIYARSVVAARAEHTLIDVGLTVGSLCNGG